MANGRETMAEALSPRNATAADVESVECDTTFLSCTQLAVPKQPCLRTWQSLAGSLPLRATTAWQRMER
ncbi:hypothetical protein PENFLA_c002G08599 [Penicillium flavigenum]|uniref:Uncharacterized protein n=1 Tax=Penicillium flavigenum TaxID=254877 RepID=A0A1V6TWE0_9EURO|nr:hypothetical protein PENFLA_c002G08599 [Penicillium flavigenum]